MAISAISTGMSSYENALLSSQMNAVTALLGGATAGQTSDTISLSNSVTGNENGSTADLLQAAASASSPSDGSSSYTKALLDFEAKMDEGLWASLSGTPSQQTVGSLLNILA